LSTRDTQHYRKLLNSNPTAAVGTPLAAAMIYSARHGSCEHADQTTDEYKQIVRSLLAAYGDSLSPIDDARKEFARVLPRLVKKEEKMEIVTNAAYLRSQLAPLYRQYPRQTSPQPAYIELNPGDRILQAEYNPEIGNAVPSRVWLNQSYRLSIPATLRGRVVADLLADPDILRLVEAVCSGHTTEWDGRNQRGYLTEAGAVALETLERNLTEDKFSEADHVWVQDVSDWLPTWELTPGKTLEQEAEMIERDAESIGVLLVGDVVEWLQDAEIEDRKRKLARSIKDHLKEVWGNKLNFFHSVFLEKDKDKPFFDR